MLEAIRRRFGYAAAAGFLALLSVVLAPVPAMAASSEPSDGILENRESRNPGLRVWIVVSQDSFDLVRDLAATVLELEPNLDSVESPLESFLGDVCSELQRKSTLFLSVTCDGRRLTFDISADDDIDKVFRLTPLGDDVFASLKEVEQLYHMRCNVIVIEPRFIHLRC